MRDKVVIITGASSGIGKALAYELAHQGAKVVLAARNIEELLHIEQDLRQQGAEVLSVRTDVTKELACKELIEQAYARFGRIDALINNAGISMRALLEDLEPGDYVMVHAGIAIAKITDEDDSETEQLMEELL
mgnify:CR=1 FL=1